MRYHFIAIGGAVMHNLALDSQQQGHVISGSDDEIFEPSRSRLEKAGILPDQTGWFPEKITKEIDAIILGMHARKDNPELLKALELKIPVYSYPEFIYRQSLDKKRIVVGGSHGKTTITSMIMHAMKECNYTFDYLVGAQLEGFETMVKITNESLVSVLEGDEYLSSALNLIPKFHVYHPHVAIISGIAWDHMNVFPTFENYCDQFVQFIQKIEIGGELIYCENDKVLVELVNNNRRSDITYKPYAIPSYEINHGQTEVFFEGKRYPLKVFGAHNLMNMEAARLACSNIGMGSKDFYSAMQTFTGAAKRLELIHKTDNYIVFKDFAHSPSKLTATINAVKEQFPEKNIYAFVELHTYSSLNPDFLEQYRGAMDAAHTGIVFYSPHTLELKNLPPINSEQILHAFNRKDIHVLNSPQQLEQCIQSTEPENSVYLMMSSGNWNGVPVFDLIKERGK